jgi:hypothetical protein
MREHCGVLVVAVRLAEHPPVPAGPLSVPAAVQVAEASSGVPFQAAAAGLAVIPELAAQVELIH